MTTLLEAHKQDAYYFGERPEWLIAYSHHRDSDILQESNWTAFLELLGGESDTVAIERSSHRGVGWVEYLVVDPTDLEKVKVAEETQDFLENYPVLDEEANSRMEWEAYEESWDSWGRKDFLKACCKRIALEYRDGVSEDFTDEEVFDAIDDLGTEEIDKARNSDGVNWLYQTEADGVSINIKGLAECANLDSLIDPAIELLWEKRKSADIAKLGQALGACPTEISLAIRQGINRVSGYRQLMQDSI